MLIAVITLILMIIGLLSTFAYKAPMIFKSFSEMVALCLTLAGLAAAIYVAAYNNAYIEFRSSIPIENWKMLESPYPLWWILIAASAGVVFQYATKIILYYALLARKEQSKDS